MIEWNGIELPGFDRRLRRVGPSRRKILADFLRREIADIASPTAAGRKTRGANTSASAPDLAGACAACRGHCCRKGGDDAYLDTAALHLAWSRLPDLNKDQLVSTYLDAVPDKAFEGSCIFHAEKGCSLPRTLRAPVCEAFLCGPLLGLVRGKSGVSD